MSAVWTPAATLAVHTEGVEEHALAHICPRSTVFQRDAHPNRAQAHLSPNTWSLAWAVPRWVRSHVLSLSTHFFSEQRIWENKQWNVNLPSDSGYDGWATTRRHGQLYWAEIKKELMNSV